VQAKNLTYLQEPKETCKYILRVYKKDKAIPLQAWTGPEGSRRFRLPDFMTIGT